MDLDPSVLDDHWNAKFLNQFDVFKALDAAPAHVKWRLRFTLTKPDWKDAWKENLLNLVFDFLDDGHDMTWGACCGFVAALGHTKEGALDLFDGWGWGVVRQLEKK